MRPTRRWAYAAMSVVFLFFLMGGDSDCDIHVEGLGGLIPNGVVVIPYYGDGYDGDDYDDDYYDDGYYADPYYVDPYYDPYYYGPCCY